MGKKKKTSKPAKKGGKRLGAGRPPKKPSDVRDVLLAFRFTAAEAAEIQASADRETGGNRNEFARRRLLGR